MGPPVALRMTPITGPGGLLADGSDVALIDVEAVDAKGERCPTFQQRVDFDISGPGVWRGGYNSGKIHSINNTYLDLEAGVNRVAVRATRSAGSITVRVKGEGLKSASVTLRSKSFPVSNGFAASLPAMPEPAVAEMAPRSMGAGAGLPPSGAAAAVGRFVTSFSYAGPTGRVRVAADAQDGGRPYVDSAATFAALPAALRGAEYVQAALGDRLYSAVDLMEIAVRAGATVWIAWDERLAEPAWLAAKFQATELGFAIAGRGMRLYRHQAAQAESLTLGSNTENAVAKDANMYVVFVTAP